jgi:hypothetical protein
MAKTYSPDQLATRTFVISMVGILLWIAAVFTFVL